MENTATTTSTTSTTNSAFPAGLPVYTTSEIGRLSPCNTLPEAIEQWSRKCQIVAISEPRDVIIRDYFDGLKRLYKAQQVYVKTRFTARGSWAVNVLTFNKDRYGVIER